MVPVTPRAEQPDTTYINASWVDVSSLLFCRGGDGGNCVVLF